MNPIKRIMRREGARAQACRLTAGYIRLLLRTGRWTVEGAEIPERLIAARRPFFVAFWHGRLLMMSAAWRYAPKFNMVISDHADGRLIAGTIRRFGFEAIAGSTGRRGATVLRAMLRAIAAGECVGVTPDGPRGPRMRVNPGVIHAARLSGAPILPLTYAARPSRLIGSWDRLMVPWPFGRGVIRWGEPIAVDRQADDAAVAAAAAALERQLNGMTRALDQELGLRTVDPAPTADDPAEARA